MIEITSQRTRFAEIRISLLHLFQILIWNIIYIKLIWVRDKAWLAFNLKYNAFRVERLPSHMVYMSSWLYFAAFRLADGQMCLYSGHPRQRPFPLLWSYCLNFGNRFTVQLVCYRLKLLCIVQLLCCYTDSFC
jgi:hypothetical protein